MITFVGGTADSRQDFKYRKDGTDIWNIYLKETIKQDLDAESAFVTVRKSLSITLGLGLLTFKMRIFVAHLCGIFHLWCIVIVQMPQKMLILYTTCFIFLNHKLSTIFFGQNLTLIGFIYFSLECVWAGPKNSQKMSSPINKHRSCKTTLLISDPKIALRKRDICYILHHLM